MRDKYAIESSANNFATIFPIILTRQSNNFTIRNKS